MMYIPLRLGQFATNSLQDVPGPAIDTSNAQLPPPLPSKVDVVCKGIMGTLDLSCWQVRAMP